MEIHKTMKKVNFFNIKKKVFHNTYYFLFTLAEDNDYNATPIEPSHPPKFQLDFKSKNPFKYDSTDDEQDDKELYGNNEQHINEEFQDTNKFFFDANDTRFSGKYKKFNYIDKGNYASVIFINATLSLKNKY